MRSVRLTCCAVAVATMTPILLLCTCTDEEPHCAPEDMYVRVFAERYAVGANCRILWSASHPDDRLLLELSRDGGRTWEVLVSEPLMGYGMSFYDWVVTQGGEPLPQQECIIRVSELDGVLEPHTSKPFAIRERVTWHVDADAPPDGDGLSWQTALRHPQDAQGLDVAIGDEMWIAEGRYTRPAGWPVVDLDDMELYGGFAGTEALREERDWAGRHAILDGEGLAEAVIVIGSCGGDVRIDGLVIQGGNASVSGLTFGGGITTRGWVGRGMQIENCIVRGNSASENGGGVYAGRSPFVVKNCVFENNSAGAAGGAIYIPAIDHVEISNCLFLNNFATVEGGAVYDNSLSPSAITTLIASCTFWGNSAGSWGSAIRRYTGVEGHVTNCVVWGEAGQVHLAGGGLVVTYSDVQGGYAGDGNIDADPLFVDTSDPDGPDDVWGTSDDGLMLALGSPCIDAADGDRAPEFDLAGSPRVDDPATPDTGVGTPPYADAGAYEYQP